MFALLAAVLVVRAATQSPIHLSDYVGTYASDAGTTFEIVAGDDLFAVVNGAKYSLQPSGLDQFKTTTGQSVPFRRDASGKVIGYADGGVLHARVSPSVTAESAALAYPRPPGQNAPDAYRYHPPADLHDGIAVGDIASSELTVETAGSVVRSILDGAHKDVHSVLL